MHPHVSIEPSNQSETEKEERARQASAAYRAEQERLVLRATKPSPNPFPERLADNEIVRRDARAHESEIDYGENESETSPTFH